MIIYKKYDSILIMNNIKDVIIIGAGASGLMAANILKNQDILVLEKNNIAGQKLLLTGNGRCNLTNYKENNDLINQIKHNQKFLYSMINYFGAKDIFEYFSQYLPLKIEKYFDQNSRLIIYPHQGDEEINN